MEFNSILSPEEEAEARRLSEIAERAERKARERQQSNSSGLISHSNNSINLNSKPKEPLIGDDKVTFISKKEREQLALKRLEEKRQEQEKRLQATRIQHDQFISGQIIRDRERELQEKYRRELLERQQQQKDNNKEAQELQHELQSIKDHYLGGQDKRRKAVKPGEKLQKVFKFDWEEDDDTTRSDLNPLYNNRYKINALFGRGYLGGIDPLDQKKDSQFLLALSEKRALELKRQIEEDNSLTEYEKQRQIQQRDEATRVLRRKYEEEESLKTSKNNLHWSDKKLQDMTERDWRIFREDFDIRIQGGRATLPLRFWSEANFPQEVTRAIQAVGYEKPSPIQRQAIPVGLAGKDIIGIAETGSGKTAAFLLPCIVYMSRLSTKYTSRCAEQGPLALVLAPTRELAQQINEEFIKLAKFTNFSSVCVVGGTDIEDQGYQLRRGTHIVIGTPGRIVDCLENNYMVLNQCNYVILDEADRMVDMGFEVQVIKVLDEMGTLLKAEDEQLAEQQLLVKSSSEQLFRTTAMFSATMPAAVEKIAKTYLRHPVIIRIGDEESGKNKRIEQRVLFLTNEGQKKSKLLEELVRTTKEDKLIIFFNAKKQCDSIGRFIENSGYSAGILHGGKSQDQREETLEYFRSGDYQILCASDVAARGLDIPNVSLVINYDCPSKIENYTHRIGRTGRAGKYGVALTFLTDNDSEVFYDLKNYLEATNMPVPQQLKQHAAAQAPSGARNESGKLINERKDNIQYSRR